MLINLQVASVASKRDFTLVALAASKRCLWAADSREIILVASKWCLRMANLPKGDYFGRRVASK